MAKGAKGNKMTEEALLIIDMLNDFVWEGAPLEVPAARKIIPQIKVLLERAQKEGNPIIFLCDSHRPDDKEFKTWPKHAIAGTVGAEVIASLYLRSKVGMPYFVYKTRYSGFYNTRLHDLLQELDVKKLVITGILTNVCIFCTAIDAVQRDYEVVVLADAVAALTEVNHRDALYQLSSVFKIKVTE